MQPAKKDERLPPEVTTHPDGQKVEVDKNELEIETHMAEREARSIVDRVLELGDGDVVPGIIKAVKSGVLDNAF